MRIKLVLNSEKNFISLPIHHNEIIQAMLYKSLPSSIAKYLHDTGFFFNGRKFKLFTFSKIYTEKFIIKDEEIFYKTPITIFISSAIEDIGLNWGENFLKKDIVNLGKNKLFLEEIQILKKPDLKETNIIKTLSPITVYKTLTKDGKKFTQYYRPTDLEFKQLIKENIKKKYSILTGMNIDDFEFDIKLISKFREVPLKYKNFFIKGIEGKFKINIDPVIFNAIYDSGLGAKNSQGFGMIEIINTKNSVV
ncbi:CRISPR-associated endoribonuclease Cas6 [Hydrogenothermus marinus]|uniref:CRISPR-associated endoribonuclease n=1 Tax=Hydrogenothermus marinus TaxID=133270 RepID=A0A3M0BA92_9AQUI|nr:CRISPR-associated endoribonuclease Cas6 [Hydrogenothermus marinus]RMA93079.1 CRISPR-associated endoribonuclease Cas6 [Hydrogenothermus marinus]